MNEMKRVGDLEVAEDMRAQRYNWRFQRIGTASPAASRRPCLSPP